MNKTINEMTPKERALFFNIYIGDIERSDNRLKVYTSYKGYRTFWHYEDRLQNCFNFLNEFSLNEIIEAKNLILLGARKEFLNNVKEDFSFTDEMLSCARYLKFEKNYSMILERDLEKQFDYYIAQRKEKAVI